MNTIFEDRPKSDKEINIILVKRDVAIECAASVTGFIFCNYDLNHVEYFFSKSFLKHCLRESIYHNHIL